MDTNRHPVQLISNASVWRVAPPLSDSPDALPQVWFEPKNVILRNGLIDKIVDSTAGSVLLQEDGVEVINGDDCYLTPGFIEPQINGALGCDFNQDKRQAIQTVLKQLPQYGIIGVLPTIITAADEDMVAAIHTLEDVLRNQGPYDTQILGLHLEGPFISVAKRGIHPAAAVQDHWQEALLSQLLSPNVKLVTLAPELDPEGTLISALRKRGIKVAAGHTQASALEMARAVEYGVSGVTHLFNAMKPFHHRDAGIVAEALVNPNLFVEIITDGIHVDSKAVAMALKAKGFAQTLLSADSISLAGTAEGTRGVFAGQTLQLQNGQAVNRDGQLGGGSVLLDTCFRNVVNWGLASVAEAVYMASAAPAKFLGLWPQTGHLAEGFPANVVLWRQHDLSVETTWINGQKAYQRHNAAVSV